MKRFLFALLYVFMAGEAFAAEPIAFAIEPESSITFEYTRDKKQHTGQLTTFSGMISFHPDALAASKAKIAINTGSLAMGDSEALDALKTPDWFDIGRFPEAVFETTFFKHIAGNHYEVEGTLTLKGLALPITLTFMLDDFSATSASITGEAILKRTDFRIGWADTEMIANEVKVVVSVKAKAQ